MTVVSATLTCDLSMLTAVYLQMSTERKLPSICLPFEESLWMDVRVEVTTRRRGPHLRFESMTELRFQGALVGPQDLQELLEFCQPRDRAEALAKSVREIPT